MYNKIETKLAETKDATLRRELVFDTFRSNRFFDGVEPTIAKNMSNAIFENIVSQGAKAAKTEEENFKAEHWGAFLRKFNAKLTALRFCFDMLPAPVVRKETVVDVNEYAEFVALAE